MRQVKPVSEPNTPVNDIASDLTRQDSPLASASAHEEQYVIRKRVHQNVPQIDTYTFVRAS